jgi:hypothetical protein
MTFRDNRRHLPVLHWVLLLTCLVLSALVAFQQSVIDDQGALIHLMSRDSSELAAIKTADANKTQRDVSDQHDMIKK